MAQPEKARKILEKAWHEIRKPGISYTRWRYKTRLLIALAELEESAGNRERATDRINKALKMARGNGARKHEARALQVKARIALHRRHPAWRADILNRRFF